MDNIFTKKEKKDFDNRVKNAYIDENGMLCLGWNKLHPSCPFGQQLIKKYSHIKKLVNNK